MAPASERDLALGHPTDVSKKWWKEATVYQIYPASFFDSDGDGTGDINGIALKLDYIKNLGVDAIWLSPIYESPQIDMGYDISNYRAIHRPYGTMADVDNLINNIHKRGLKLVMDLVVNHTSDQHEWFQQSKSSTTNAFRDWYIWRPGQVINGIQHPPNNWKGMFGGSTWTFDPTTCEYYLHCFASQQPDLNWENPAVVQAVHDVMLFWLRKGVDGFRMDVINFIAKAPNYPNAPITEPGADFQDASSVFANGPRLHEFLKGMGSLLRAYDAFSVGEMPFAKNEQEVLRVVSSSSGELNMIFQFDIVDMDIGLGGKFTPKDWNLRDLKKIVRKWQNLMYDNSGWGAIFAENHDQSRTVSRFATDHPEQRTYAAKMLATWLACQSGTLYIYQGQELGMRNVPEEWPIEEYKDIETRNYWTEFLSSSPNVEDLRQSRSQVQRKARDNARTPVQWANTSHGGFTRSSDPWMKANPDYEVCNAAAQIDDESSVYRYWSSILALRRKYKDLLVYGSFILVDAENQSVFAYQKNSHGSRAIVVLNWSCEPVEWNVPCNTMSTFERGRLLQSNYSRSEVCLVGGSLLLSPWEALVLHEELGSFQRS